LIHIDIVSFTFTMIIQMMLKTFNKN